MNNVSKVLDDFLEKGIITKEVSEDGKEETVCNLETGECYIIRTKDGLIERINKKYITEDGRTLLQD